MIRLVLVTVAAMVAVMMFWGEPGAQATVTPEAPATTPEPAPAPEAPAPAPEPAAAPEPAPAPAAQTPAPAPTPRLPGPALRPSPEYAGQATAPEAPAAAPQGEGTVMYVTGNRVNLRASPTTGDAVVGALTKGSVVRATGPAQGGWLPITDADGRAGFMAEQFLSETRP